MMRLCLLLSGLVGCSALGAETFRNWTDIQNRTVEAALVGVEGDQVKLKLRNGTVATVPLARFSAADQEFAKAGSSPAASPASTTPSGGGVAAPAAGGLENPPAEKVWPRSVALEDAPQVVTVTEDAEKKEFVYKSPHYEFRCDSRLSVNVVREFGRIFEATYLVNCKLPLDIKPQPEPLREMFLATLYTNKEDYFTNGGIKGSAGVYQRAKKSLSAPLSSLGVKMLGSRVSLDYTDLDNQTLIHEITHQMMNHWLRKMPTWLIEGSADYVAMADYERGRFNFGQMDKALTKYLPRRGMRGGVAEMVKPEQLIQIDNRTWSAALSEGGASLNYASAAMLTFFFYRIDGEKDGAHMIAFMRAIEGGMDYKEATAQHLLRGRDFPQLEKEVAAGLKKAGVEVTFVAAKAATSASN